MTLTLGRSIHGSFFKEVGLEIADNWAAIQRDQC